MKFFYPKSDPNPRLVYMKSWVKQGPLLTGFDTEAGGIRSFFWDRIAKWLPLEEGEQNKSAGRLRRNGHIRRRAMFRKLASAKNLKWGATDQEAWVGFFGRAADVARVHQEGLRDRPSKHWQPVQYPRRELLGVTESDRARMLDALLNALNA